MTPLQDWLIAAGTACGIPVVAPFALLLPSGAVVKASALLMGLGDAKGMLIFHTFDEIRELSEEIRDAGYGYSTLSEPDSGEPLDLDSFKEMFRDWGWKG